MEKIPYWLVDQLPLLLFIFAFLFIIKLRSKRAVIFFITLSAMITFFLSYAITTACWADLKCSLSSGQEVCLVNSYCHAEDENGLAIAWAFLKVFFLWVVALKIFFIKVKFRKKSVVEEEA